MDNKTWNRMSSAEKEKVRDLSDLTPQLKGLENHRVEVVTTYNEKRRFIVGRSTGWKPINLERKRIDSISGFAAEKTYKSVKVIEYVSR